MKASAVAVVAVLILALARQTAADSALGLMRESQAAFARDDLRGALELMRRAVKTAPDWREGVLQHAALAEFMGEFDEAAAAYERALALPPNDAEPRYGIASLAARLGNYDRALQEIDALVNAHALPFRFVYRYGPTWSQRHLLAWSPTIATLVDLRIDVLMERGDLDGARRVAWDYAVIQTGRDYCGERKAAGRRATADDALRLLRLATLAQDSVECMWWYGQTLTDSGYMRLGRVMVTEALRQSPSVEARQPSYRYLKSRLGGGREIAKPAEALFLAARQRYLRNRDGQGATRLLDEALRIAPAFDRLYIMKARIASEAGDRMLGVELLQRALQADPASWRAHHNLGRAYIELKRWTEAERELTTALALYPEDTSSRVLLARAAYEQRDFERYAQETQHILGVARVNDQTQALSAVSAFYESFRAKGPGAGVPPVPEIQVFIGYDQD